jgi:hypothetical protein
MGFAHDTLYTVQVALQVLKTVKIGLVQLALQVPKNQLIMGKRKKQFKNYYCQLESTHNRLQYHN